MKKTTLFLVSLIAFSGFLVSCGEDDPQQVYSCVDYDGNKYESVVIGNQVWMTENLRAVHATDGGKAYLPIELVNWVNKDVAKRFFLDNDTAYVKIYGYMYNFYAVENGKLAPRRWRIPSKEDWEALFNYVKSKKFSYEPSESSNWIGKALASRLLWNQSEVIGSIGYDLSTNNVTGFNALPGGIRTSNGEYEGEKYRACFWTSTLDSATNRPLVVYINNYDLEFRVDTFLSNEEACYVRCVRDVR